MFGEFSGKETARGPQRKKEDRKGVLNDGPEIPHRNIRHPQPPFRGRFSYITLAENLRLLLKIDIYKYKNWYYYFNITCFHNCTNSRQLCFFDIKWLVNVNLLIKSIKSVQPQICIKNTIYMHTQTSHTHTTDDETKHAYPNITHNRSWNKTNCNNNSVEQIQYKSQVWKTFNRNNDNRLWNESNGNTVKQIKQQWHPM